MNKPRIKNAIKIGGYIDKADYKWMTESAKKLDVSFNKRIRDAIRLLRAAEEKQQAAT